MYIYIVTYKTKNENKNKKKICNGARDERENLKENKNIVTCTFTLWRLMVIYLS